MIKQSDNGLRIKTWHSGSGAVAKNNLQQHRNGQSQKPNYYQPILLPQRPLPQSNCCPQDIWCFTCTAHTMWKTHLCILMQWLSSMYKHHTFSGSTAPSSAAQGDGELNLEPPFCWKAYGIIETRVTRPLRSCLMGELPKNNLFFNRILISGVEDAVTVNLVIGLDEIWSCNVLKCSLQGSCT